MGDVDFQSINAKVRQEKSRIVSHNFKPRDTDLAYDYAIIEFEPPLEEAEMSKYGSTERPACLPREDIHIADSFQIAGWGSMGKPEFDVTS